MTNNPVFGGTVELNISNMLSQKFLSLGYKMWKLLKIIVGPEIQLPSIRSLKLRDPPEKLGEGVSWAW